MQAIELIGRKIKEIRPMTDEEMEAEYWDSGIHGNPTLLVLDDGTKLYPSRDMEGNGGGAFFGTDADGKQFGLA